MKTLAHIFCMLNVIESVFDMNWFLNKTIKPRNKNIFLLFFTIYLIEMFTGLVYFYNTNIYWENQKDMPIWFANKAIKFVKTDRSRSIVLNVFRENITDLSVLPFCIFLRTGSHYIELQMEFHHTGRK